MSSDNPGSVLATMPTIRQLDDAIRGVLGADVYKSLLRSRTGRVTMHQLACVNAFAEGRIGPDVEVLRALLVELKRTGVYPAESWTGEEDKHG